jgi:serine protease Do
MKQTLVKGTMAAAIALLILPSAVWAQKEKEKAEKDEKKNHQTIVISRNGNTDEKMVIEVNGEKVLINGKDAKETKDVHVNVHTLTDVRGARALVSGHGADKVTMDFDNLFDEDENRAMLGVVTQESSDDDVDGAKIASVNDNSAAQKAGLKKGDIIKKIGTKKIESTGDVTSAIRSHKPGEKVDVVISRNGKEETLTAELGKWKGIRNAVTVPRFEPGQWNAGTQPTPFQSEGSFGTTLYAVGRPKLGLSIQDTEDGVGVKVLDVDEDSHAAKAGIRKDDVIVGVDDHEIRGTDDISRHIKMVSRDKFTYNFRVKRDGKTQNIEVKIPRKLKTADL